MYDLVVHMRCVCMCVWVALGQVGGKVRTRFNG